MSTPLIFKSIRISDAGGSSNAVTYNIVPVETRELGIEATTELVDDGQTLKHNANATITFVCRALAILNDTRITFDGADQKGLCRLEFLSDVTNGSLRFDNIRLSGTDNLESTAFGVSIVGSYTKSGSVVTRF